MQRIAVWMGLLGLAWAYSAAVVYAAVPQTMSYQGVLTDASGVLVPDGNYDLTFRLYTATTGGVAVWTESRTAVPVVQGGIAVTLGSVTPLTLAFDVPYYLGVTVGTDPELSPRAALSSSPYTFGLRLPFSGSANVSGAAFTVRNTSPSNLPDISAYRTIQLGGASAAKLRLFGPSTSLPTAELGVSDSPGGGYFTLAGPTGATAINMLSAAGAGAIYLTSGPGGGALNLSGSGSNAQPQLDVLGATKFCSLITGASGDAAVSFPDSSISSSEMLNEPGVSQGAAPGQVSIGASVTPIVSTTLTIPASGYIVLDADMHLGINPGVSVAYQIGEMASVFDGSTNLANNPSGVLAYVPTSAHRTYFKSAGTYTFYFHAQVGIANSAYASNSRLTAMYFPTGYGNVSDIFAVKDAGEFQSRAPVAADLEPGAPVISAAVVVDLRELELRVEADRTALQRSRLALLKAQAREREAESAESRAVSAAKP